MIAVQKLFNDWKYVFSLNPYLAFLHSKYFSCHWTKKIPNTVLLTGWQSIYPTLPLIRLLTGKFFR